MRELLDARETELQSLHESIRGMHGEAALRIGELESEVSGLQLERERALKSTAAVEAERDSARSTVESLLVRLKQIEASDDERLKAQRSRIEELTRDLSEALDMAAKKETELMLALSEQERLQRQIAELTERRDTLAEELEKFRSGGTNGVASPSTGLSEIDRRAIVDQLRDAITLIDKHLGEG
jgi:chromosome segregation ATPase